MIFKRTCIATAMAAILGAGCTARDPDEMELPNPGGKGDSVGTPDAGDEPTDPNAPIFAIDVSHWTKTITDPDVDCFWEKGYRHVIVGTQIYDISREQLEVAIRGGMTVDLYVYIYWSDTVERQMQEALDLIAEFPEIGRVWIDVEEQDTDGLWAGAIEDYVQACIDYMNGFPVGIYTGKGFWDSVLFDSQKFGDIPLWYARYDNVMSLDTFAPGNSHYFGAWDQATGKQYDDHNPGTCGRAVDKNVLIRNVQPQFEIDRSPAIDDGDPPDVLLGMWPADGLQINTVYVRPTAIPSREATRYEISIDYWSGTEFRPYWTTKRNVSDLTVYPTLKNKSYRWRIRAENQHGWSDWTDWSWFNFGQPTKPFVPEAP